LHALQALVQQAEREVTRRRQELAVLTELDAENSAAVDRAGELVAGLHSELDQLESDLDQFIKKGDK
jgi:septation ring formation regulator EzrA